MHKIAPITLFIAALLLAAGCGEKLKEERGLRYMPDMYQSPALKSLEAQRIVETDENGKVVKIREVPGLINPPPGSISRNLPYTEVTAAWQDATVGISNPLAPTPAVLRLGRVKYGTYCAVCHGTDGDVNNNYLGDKLSGVIPLNTDAVAKMTDEHVFQVITHGIRRMPNYKAQLLPDERWALIHYVRVLHQAAQLPPAEKEALLAEEAIGEFDEFKPKAEPIPEYKASEWPEGFK